jgi:O-antigen ligase
LPTDANCTLTNTPTTTDGALEGATSALAVMATFSKGFAPFQFFGSTLVFFISLSLCLYCIVLNAPRNIARIAGLLRELIPIVALLTLMTANYILISDTAVPVTYLIGIIGFWCAFFCLGAVCTDVRSAFSVLVVFSAIYLVFVVGFFLDNGAMYIGDYFGDIFGIDELELSSGTKTIQLYQNVGYLVSVGAISFGAFAKRFFTRPLTATAIAIMVALVVDVAVQARGAAIALVCATMFIFESPLKQFWIPLSVFCTFVLMAAVSFWALFPQDLGSSGFLSKILDELAQGRSDGRLFLFGAASDRIVSDGVTFLVGRGLGMFPIDLGYQAPDWLIAPKAVSMYPHNVVIEAQYEMGILGTVLVLCILLRPLVVFRSIPRDHDTKILACIYVFYLVSSLFSGSLAYSYPLLFVLGMFWAKLATLENLMSNPSDLATAGPSFANQVSSAGR